MKTIIALSTILSLSPICSAMQQETVKPTFTTKMATNLPKVVKFTDRLIGRGMMGVLFACDSIIYGALKGHPYFEQYLEKKQPDAHAAYVKSYTPLGDEHQELTNIANNLAQKMNLPPTKVIHIHVAGKAPQAGVNGVGIIKVNSAFLKELSLSQQTAVIGHELSHTYFNDNENKYLFDAAAIIATAKGGTFCAKKIHASQTMPRLRFAKNSLAAVLGSAVVQFAASQIVSASYDRFKEKRADLHGLKFTGNAQDCIDALKVRQKSEYKSTGLTKLFDTHPDTNTRIAYFKTYMKQSDIRD